MIIKKLFLSILILLLISVSIQAQTPKRINVGYFEGGKYQVHSVLREEYFKHLEAVLPEDYLIVTIPEGYRSAEWNRKDCKAMALQLSRIKHLDMIIAVGPWVVHDLLEAGFDKPILAMHQFDPYLEGLLDSTGKPIAENLTVTQRRGRIFTDLSILSQLIRVKKLGLLYFPSADEKEKVYSQFKAVGQKLDIEIVIGEGDDNAGTFAFFKAFNDLGQRVDAVYLPPLWGMDKTKVSEFFKMLAIKRIPAFTYEGNILVDKGAFATNDYFGIISEARFNAVKTVRMIKGESPADLPILLISNDGLAVNLNTAAKCKISLPEDITNNYHIIEAEIPEETAYYSMNDAIERVILQNPGYLALEDILEASTFEAEQAKSAYRPQIYGQAAYKHIFGDSYNNDFSFFDVDQINSSINLDQTILSLPALKNIKLASKRRHLKEIDLTQSQLDLELSVEIIYMEYLRNKEILKILRNNRKLSEHNIELAKAKNYYEQSDTLDIIHFENYRYNLSLQIIEVRKNLKTSQIMLNRLFNLPGDELFVLDSMLFAERSFLTRENILLDKIQTVKQQQEIANKLLFYALNNNPGLTGFDLSANIQKDMIDINKGRYFPEIGLRGSFNYKDRLNESSFFKEDKSTWTVETYLNWPLFLGGSRSKENSKIKAELSATEFEKDEYRLEIMETIFSEFNKLLSYSSRMTPAYQNKIRALGSLEIALSRFTKDSISSLDIVNLQTRSIDADLDFINSRFNYYKSMSRIIHAAGIRTNESYTNFVEEFHKLAEY